MDRELVLGRDVKFEQKKVPLKAKNYKKKKGTKASFQIARR